MIALLFGAAAAWAVGTWARPSTADEGSTDLRATVPETSVDSRAVDAARISEALLGVQSSLDRIEARVAGLERERASRPQPVSSDRESEASDPNLPTLVASIQALERRIEEELEKSRKGRIERIQELRELEPDPDWTELQPLVDLNRTDIEGARREVQLMSEADVLARFGAPSMMWGTPDDLRWVYGQDYDPASDSYRLQVVLRIQRGYVTNLYVERN